MTYIGLTDEEVNWVNFYKWQTDLEGVKKNNVDGLKDWLNIKELSKTSETFIDKNGNFDCDIFFKLFFSIRLLNVGQKIIQDKILKEVGKDFFDEDNFEDYLERRELKEGENDFDIPKNIKEYLRWWINIGKCAESQSGNMDGKDNQLIFSNKVPNWIKVHILSRFIMRRNAALVGSKNFEINSKIVEDNKYALNYAKQYLKSAKRDISRESMIFHGNKFMSAGTIENLYEIEKLLFKVRTEKDIDAIIMRATKVLGSSLTIRNRFWAAITSYWCNHVLWRCFICTGDVNIAKIFRNSTHSFNEYIEKTFDLKMPDIYASKSFVNYEKNKASKYYKILRRIINLEKKPFFNKKIINDEILNLYYGEDEIKIKKKEDLKELTEDLKGAFFSNLFEEDIDNYEKKYRSKRKHYSKKGKPYGKFDSINLLFYFRRTLYKEFIDAEGMEDFEKWSRKGGKGKKVDWLSHVDREEKLEGRIEKIPEIMENVLNYLDESQSIVAIPTTRLVIIDLLLQFSRISISRNKDEKIPTWKHKNKIAPKSIDKKQEEKIDSLWKDETKPALEKMIKHITKAKSQLKALISEERLYDFDKIIKVLSEVLKGTGITSKFSIDGVTELKITTRNAGEKINDLLVELVDEKDGVKLHFPVKNVTFQ